MVNLDTQNAIRHILEGYSPSGGLGLSLTSVEAVTGASINFAGYDGADIRVGASTTIEENHAYLPENWFYGGDVWLMPDNGTASPGTWAYMVLLHELGHALGLLHGHDRLSRDKDSVEYSVMTYRTYLGQTDISYLTYGEFDAPQTLMMYDIAALQKLYGANFSTHNGHTTYRWDPSTGETFTIMLLRDAQGEIQSFLQFGMEGGRYL
jgi:serralysin